MSNQVTEAAPAEPSADERFTAQLCWGIDVIVHALGPYLLWRFQAPDSAFVAHHAKACVNHVLTVMVLILMACAVFFGAGFAAAFLTEPKADGDPTWYYLSVMVPIGLGLCFVPGLMLFSLVVHALAWFAAGAGKWYRPPLCWRFVR